LTLDSIVAASRSQVSSDLAGEKVILGIESGMYYGLKGVGARIWDLLAEPRAVSEIRDTIASEYDVATDRAEADLLALLGRLLDEKLIEIRDRATP
jgi:hypothetical protein